MKFGKASRFAKSPKKRKSPKKKVVVDINRLNSSDETLLSVAVKDKKYNKIESLLKNGADSNSPTRIPIIQSARGNMKILSLLLDPKYNKNYYRLNSMNQSLLSTAIENQNLIVVEMLLKRGVDPNILCTDYKKSPFVLAYETSGSLNEITKLLLDSGSDPTGKCLDLKFKPVKGYTTVPHILFREYDDDIDDDDEPSAEIINQARGNFLHKILKYLDAVCRQCELIKGNSGKNILKFLISKDFSENVDQQAIIKYTTSIVEDCRKLNNLLLNLHLNEEGKSMEENNFMKDVRDNIDDENIITQKIFGFLSNGKKKIR